MEKTNYIWMDGRKIAWDDAKVHCLTHSLHYGSGAFEGIRFYETSNGPAIFKLKDHVDRIYYSANAISMDVPYAREEFTEAIIDTVRYNNVNQGYVRPVFYYGDEELRVNPSGCSVHAFIAVWPWGHYLAGENPIKVIISSYIRIHHKSTVADAKITGHYVNSILANIEAQNKGVDEALLLDCNGNIAEGPGENIFMVNDGKLYTPALGTILAGITRETIIDIAKAEGIEVIENDLLPDDLYSADELFFTGTAAEVSPIGEIDGKVINNNQIGPVTKKIRDLYMDIVYGRDVQYTSWLTYINNN